MKSTEADVGKWPQQAKATFGGVTLVKKEKDNQCKLKKGQAIAIHEQAFSEYGMLEAISVKD